MKYRKKSYFILSLQVNYTFKHQNKRNFASVSLKLNNLLGIIIKANRRKGNAREIIARENKPEIYFWREMVFCYQNCSDLL